MALSGSDPGPAFPACHRLGRQQSDEARPCDEGIETSRDIVRKAELIRRNTWNTRRQAEMAIFEYINGLYNPRRRHSALGWKSPVAFERKVA